MKIDLTDAKTLEMNGEKKFELLPPDRYPLQIDNVDEKENNKGKFLTLRFEVIDGQYQRRKIFQDFLIESSDKDDNTLSWIGTSLSKLKLILSISGKKIEQPENDDFLGIKLEGTVTQDVSNADSKYHRNKIAYYRKLEGYSDAADALQEAVNKQFADTKKAESSVEELEDDPF